MMQRLAWLLIPAFAVLLFSNAAEAVEPADLVIRRANVLTMSAERPRATAFAIRAGKFIAVGSEDDVQPLIGKGTAVLELGGKTVLPGFIDAHVHPRPIFPVDSRWYTVDVGPGAIKTMDELIAALKRKAAITPAGAWVTGFGYQETKLGRHPSRQDLDRASTKHPILIRHSSGHLSACNSLALERAGVNGQTKDPPGGQFERDVNGEPTGVLKEQAAAAVRQANPMTEDPPEADLIAAYRTCLQRFVRRGLTSVHAAGTDPRTADRLAKAQAGNSPVRLYIMLREDRLDEAVRRKRLQKPDEAQVRFGAIKLFHGNSLSGQTCWLSKPYAHRKDYFGIPPARPQSALNQTIRAIHEAGLQACVHTNGDREIDMVLDAFAAALARSPRPNHRHRLEHCSVVNETIQSRIKQLGLVVVPHSYVYEHGDKMENYGPDRWDWMLPNRSLLDLGVPVAGHSDYPVSAADPLLRIQDMVTRRSAEGKVYGLKQRTTVEQALRVWTLGGAYASFEEEVKGSIERGKLADFVVLTADPTRVEADRIKDIAIERTVIGGRGVFSRKE
jgi:predicted amidohydrolase YtcJ